MRKGQYLEYFPGRLEPHFLERATSGEIYSIHAPGVSVVVLPAFAIAGYAGAVGTMILIAALTAALSWRIAWRVSGSAAAAWASVIAVFGTTPYFFHTFTIYPEIIGGFAVTVAAWLLLELSEQRPISPRMLVAVGSALAVLPWLHTRFAVLAGLLGVMVAIRLAARTRPAASIAMFLAVPAVAGAAWFGYFWLIWGDPSPMAPYGADTSTSASYIGRGLIGLLFDQQFGVLTTAPIYLLAIAGVLHLFRRQPRLTIELALVALAYAITVASYQMWWAGSAAPARFLVSILPLAVLPIAALLGNPRDGIVSTTTGVTAVLLVAVSVLLVVPRALVEAGRFIFSNRAPLDATLEWLSPIVDLSVGASERAPRRRIDGASRWRSVGGGRGGVGGGGECRQADGGRSVDRVGAGARARCDDRVDGGVGLASDAAMITPQRSQLWALAGFRPSWQHTMVDLAGLRRIPEDRFLAALSLVLSSSASRINRVPAGEYELRVTAPATPGPLTLALSVGRNDPPIETPALDDLRDSRSEFRLRLPVSVRTLNLRDGRRCRRRLALADVAAGRGSHPRQPAPGRPRLALRARPGVRVR